MIQTRRSGTRIHDDTPRPDTLTRPRAPNTGLSYNIKEMIINTLKKLKATGLKHRTLYATSYTLKKIAEHADLLKPEEVKTYITNCNVSNSYKNNLLALEREP